MKYCLGCMEPLYNEDVGCLKCGYKQDSQPKESYHLFPETILHERYLIGRTLGYGGFGVTYIGMDLLLKKKVAIKEYLPSEFATRSPEQRTLSVYTGEAEIQFLKGLDSFEKEAKRLAKLTDIPGVVKIYDIFHENKTAYIVMEYLEGETVAEKLKKRGKLSYEETEAIMVSVLSTLEEIHATGMIHRDVSPGNIFVTKDSQVKLIDFGAARFASVNKTKSLSIILKPGYAPEEQYRSRGEQGPWTDVYSAAATMYKMLTGITPQESIERMAEDKLADPGKIGVKIEKNKENALMNALNVSANDRTRSAGQFLNELCGEEVDRKKVVRKKGDEGKTPLWLKIVAAAVPLLAVAAIFMFMNHGISAANDNFTVVPNIINKTSDEAETVLSESELNMMISGTVDVEFGESDLVQKVVPAVGTYLEKGARVEVYISRNITVNMPDILYRDIDAAYEEMETAGLNVKTEYVETDDFIEGTVIYQEYKEGEPLSKNSLVLLKVASGNSGTGEIEAEMPDVAGKNVEEAIENLREAGYYLLVSEGRFDESSVGTILEQKRSENAGEENIVYVTISRGEKYIFMPDIVLSEKESVKHYFEENEISVKYEYVGTLDYKQDMVLEQKPSAGEKLYAGDEVTIVLSLEGTMNFKAGEMISFGNYEQDNNLENGAEAVEWQVLDVQDGRALVISRYGLDCKPYNTEYKAVTWETCSLRKWLNGEFVKETFSAEDQKVIISTSVSTPNNPEYGTRGGNDTTDKVFLLSTEEADKYFQSSDKRQCKPSAYAAAQGTDVPVSGNCQWWLRSPGWNQNNATGVMYGGSIVLKDGDSLVAFSIGVQSVDTVVRPAMWLDIYEMVKEEDTSGFYIPEVGSTVTLGNYEQDNNPGNGAEPIEWQVLDIQDGKAFLISKYVLEARNSKNILDENLNITGEMETWLNNTFYNKAFSESEKEGIIKRFGYFNYDEYYGRGNGTFDLKIRFLTINEYYTYKKEVGKLFGGTKYVTANYNFDVENGTPWSLLGGIESNEAHNAAGDTIRSPYKPSFTGMAGIRPAMWVDVEIIMQPGKPLYFGEYEQDGNAGNGAEPIEWQVLDVQDEKVLLISKYILDSRPYHSSRSGDIFWENCSLREWLNNEFYNEAFSQAEQELVLKTEVKAETPSDGAYNGKDTADKVFLLSTREASLYFKNEEALEAETTAAAAKNSNTWWLRTVRISGTENGKNSVNPTLAMKPSLGYTVTYEDFEQGIRPAIWVDIEVIMQPENSFYFGEYEQDGNTGNGEEPIEWQVLDVQDGKMLVISRFALDCMPYNTARANVTWENSSLRKWLNDDFISSALSSQKQSLIVTAKLSNPDNPKYGTEGGKDTEDKVFLLSIAEAEKYFPSAGEKGKCEPTEYVKTAFADENSRNWWWFRSPGYPQNCAAVFFGSYNQYGFYRTNNFTVSQDGVYVNQLMFVRPAMWVDVSVYMEAKNNK